MKDDTISRWAVIRAVDKHTREDGTLDDDISCILEDLPSAQPEYTEQDMRNQFNAGYTCGMEAAQSERKRGKWKGYNMDKIGWKRTDGSPVFLICSECGGTVMNNGSAHWNYCPHCGSEMDEWDDEFAKRQENNK